MLCGFSASPSWGKSLYNPYKPRVRDFSEYVPSNDPLDCKICRKTSSHDFSQHALSQYGGAVCFSLRMSCHKDNNSHLYAESWADGWTIPEHWRIAANIPCNHNCKIQACLRDALLYQLELERRLPSETRAIMAVIWQQRLLFKVIWLTF